MQSYREAYTPNRKDNPHIDVLPDISDYYPLWYCDDRVCSMPKHRCWVSFHQWDSAYRNISHDSTHYPLHVCPTGNRRLQLSRKQPHRNPLFPSELSRTYSSQSNRLNRWTRYSPLWRLQARHYGLKIALRWTCSLLISSYLSMRNPLGSLEKNLWNRRSHRLSRCSSESAL